MFFYFDVADLKKYLNFARIFIKNELEWASVIHPKRSLQRKVRAIRNKMGSIR